MPTTNTKVDKMAIASFIGKVTGKNQKNPSPIKEINVAENSIS